MQCNREQFPFPRRARLTLVGMSVRAALALSLVAAVPLIAQQYSSSESESTTSPPSSSSSSSSVSNPEKPKPFKEPALVDPAGPEVSLQNSEALFDIAAALNSCGYDEGLAQSDPVRTKIRGEIDQALRSSAEARDAHDRLCLFIDQHRLADHGLDLAQYISLALYTTPPPTLTTSADSSDMPPDATQVMDILPLLRDFSNRIDLHLIWVENRPYYQQELDQLHDPLSQMIVQTNAYLRVPVTGYSGRRFLVVIEPLLDPRQTNARVYGSDYVVVASPMNGAIRMDDVRHTYLHYEIEPLLYARSATIYRLEPFLKIVRDAPIDYEDRSDVVALVVECMIRAIEARTMDTGVKIYKIPADIRRSDLEAATREHSATVERDEAIRRSAVQRSLLQGYVLTPYFYNAFAAFEKEPQSFIQSIGEMVYGMDVEAELGRVKHIDFVAQAPAEIVQRPRPPVGLDLAEADLAKGDADAAGTLAQKALQGDPAQAGRANFILARVAILHGDVPAAQHDFQESIRLSKDPRTLAWSHIYLGRIYDVQDHRDQAVTEYQAALTVRDGQPDTKRAAEKGLQQPYTVPQTVHTDAVDGSAPGAPDQPTPADQAHPPQR
jgi:tetratricopeptide (TPR) repeat protein